MRFVFQFYQTKKFLISKYPVAIEKTGKWSISVFLCEAKLLNYFIKLINIAQKIVVVIWIDKKNSWPLISKDFFLLTIEKKVSSKKFRSSQ